MDLFIKILVSSMALVALSFCFINRKSLSLDVSQPRRFIGIVSCSLLNVGSFTSIWVLLSFPKTSQAAYDFLPITIIASYIWGMLIAGQINHRWKKSICFWVALFAPLFGGILATMIWCDTVLNKKGGS